MEHLPDPNCTPATHLHSLPAPRFFLLICGLALILSALLLACGGEESVEQNGSGQGARPAEATAEARAEEGDPTATRAVSTGAPASTPQSGSASTAAAQAEASTPTATRAVGTGAPASTPQSGDAPTSEAAAAPTFAPTPMASESQCPMDPAPTTVRPSAQTTPETDRETLIALFNATDGESWDDSGIWSGPAPIRQWPGVSTDDNGRVTGLNLKSIPLEEIPPELGNLASLQRLDLSDTQLSGEIPPELGNLTSLQVLDLSENALTGEIPSELGKLASLTGLFLSSNQLSGCIPPELGDLTSLQKLNLHENQLSGEIPPDLGNLARLIWLVLGGNQLSGEIPPDLGKLTSLEYLDLSGNQLSGEIPPELGNLTSLQVLDLSENALTGEIPSELGKLASLTGLFLSSNQLSGELPPELDNLTSLESLYLRGNQFRCISDVLRDRFNRVSEDFPVCAIEDPGDKEALVALYIAWGVTLTREPIYEWEGVSIDSNGRVVALTREFRRAIPPELGNLTNLQVLVLRGDPLKGEIPGEIPPELGNLTNLQVLVLRGNRLSGQIPPELGNLTSLRVLDLAYNLLSGQIPPELATSPACKSWSSSATICI